MTGLTSLEGWARALTTRRVTRDTLEGAVDVFPVEARGALGTAWPETSLATAVANETVIPVFIPSGRSCADSAAFGGSRLEGVTRTAGRTLGVGGVLTLGTSLIAGLAGVIGVLPEEARGTLSSALGGGSLEGESRGIAGGTLVPIGASASQTSRVARLTSVVGGPPVGRA